MDNILGRLSLYELVGVIVPGGVAVGGVYWAFAGVPDSVGVSGFLALLGVLYVAGQLLQALLRAPLGDRVWGRRQERTAQFLDVGGRPYSDDFMALLERRAATRGWPEVREEPHRVVALARAELRAKKLDARAETMLAMHFLCLGLLMASVVVAVGSFAAAIWERDWSRVALAVGAVVAAALFRRRADDYDRYYADHVWSDFGALQE